MNLCDKKNNEYICTAKNGKSQSLCNHCLKDYWEIFCQRCDNGVCLIGKFIYKDRCDND